LELEHGRASPISPQVDHRDTARTERRWRARQEGGLSSPGVNRQSFLSWSTTSFWFRSMLVPVYERFWWWGLASDGEVMTMQIDNKSDSLSNNLWAEMTLMTALVVILLGILWQFLW
jgi:hypothetical protein